MTNIMCKFTLLAAILPMHMVLADRLMVPDYVTCDRNQLTSWTGQISDYQRTSGSTQFTVKTDDGTTEILSLSFLQKSELMTQYFLNGKRFESSDWKRIEGAKQQLISGTRATVWLCQDASFSPVVNWQVKEEVNL